MPDLRLPPAPERREARQSDALFHPLIPAIGFALLACMAWLYASGSDFYGRILAYWTFIPWPYPFIDTAVIPRWIRCSQLHGLVVYTDASWGACGLGPMNYSPLWLRLTFLPTEPRWWNWYGVSLVALFLLSLGLLPWPRQRGERVLVVLATFSCLPVFAMERGNLDLLVFLLAVCAALCLGGTLGRRILGYSLMLLGGLLKFYPLVALVLILRERLVVLVAVALAAAAIVTGTAIVLLDELNRMRPVPGGAPFENLWGAANLITGFPIVLRTFLEASGLPGSTVATLSQARFVMPVIAICLRVSTVILALRLSRRDDLRAALAAIPDRTHRFLLIGALLVVGCFFAHQNVGYRGVFLLLTLPGFLALIHASGRLRPAFILAVGCMMSALWALTIRHLIGDAFGISYDPIEGSLIGDTVWVVQELAWWWLVTILLAILLSFVAESPAWRDLRSLASRRLWARGERMPLPAG